MSENDRCGFYLLGENRKAARWRRQPATVSKPEKA
jgi:hypothetical protein